MKQPEQSYTAIETAHGFVFFTDTTEGQKNRQDFLQFMADHYFDPHFNLGPVNVYRAEGVLKDGLEMAEKVGVACVPGTSFFNENINHIVRVHFAKKDETLYEALERLSHLKEKMG